MRSIQVRFTKNPSLDHIEVVVSAPELDADVSALIEQIGANALDVLTVSDESGSLFTIPIASIVRIFVQGKMTSIVTEDRRYLARQSLQNVEQVLDPSRFVRISRYEIVNLRKVVRYDFTLSGTLRLELTGGMETWASRRCIPQIRRLLQGKE